MKSILLSSLAIVISVFIANSGHAQTNDVPGQDVQGQLSARDFKFVKAAVQGGKMEVKLGQIATQNAQDQGVRDFGTKMVQDHQVANQELAQILSQKGATVSEAPGWMEHWMHEKMISHLQELKGTEFDTAYMKHMVKDHKEDIKEFQKETESGDDADIKNFASKTLPTLQEHLRLAQDTQARLNSSASK